APRGLLTTHGPEEGRVPGLPAFQAGSLRRAAHGLLVPRVHAAIAEGRVPEGAGDPWRSRGAQPARRLRQVRGAQEEAVVLAPDDGGRVLARRVGAAEDRAAGTRALGQARRRRELDGRRGGSATRAKTRGESYRRRPADRLSELRTR